MPGRARCAPTVRRHWLGRSPHRHAELRHPGPRHAQSLTMRPGVTRGMPTRRRHDGLEAVSTRRRAVIGDPRVAGPPSQSADSPTGAEPNPVFKAVSAALDKALTMQRRVVAAHVQRIKRRRPEASDEELVRELEKQYLITVGTLGRGGGRCRRGSDLRLVGVAGDERGGDRGLRGRDRAVHPRRRRGARRRGRGSRATTRPGPGGAAR